MRESMWNPLSITLGVVVAVLVAFIVWCVFIDVPEPKTVFVTSELSDGNFGEGQQVLGHLRADARCQQAAELAGLAGEFKAWIAGRLFTDDDASMHGPVDRFNHAAGDYRLVDGAKVADGWADLTDGTLDRAINMDEHGNLIAGQTSVWTNSDPQGEAISNLSQCAQGPATDIPGEWTWSCGQPSWSPGDCQNHVGRVGSASAVDARWTGNVNTGSAVCTSSLRLYCFEQ